jgi:hypothetical protein
MTCKHPTCNGKCRRVKKRAISKRSKKMADQMKVYNQRRRKFLIANPVCAVTGEPSTEIHHKAGRIGRLLLEESLWLAVSRRGHTWIEEHPKEAKELGYSQSRLKKSA